VFTVLIAFVWPQASGILRPLERWFSRLAQRKRLSVAIVGITAGLVRLAILPWLPIPEPFFHDEFSYLLAADTFSSGRLTNATHPMWTYMESFHISHVPTYMSMYFPAQGVVLAFGKVVFGHPWFGVWLSTAVLSASICWMLQSWLPPGRALLGGFLAILRLSLFSYWGNMYYGGTMSAIGGCLVLGGARRFTKTKRPRDLLLFSGGAIILASSRPVEGLLLCVPVVLAMAWSLFRSEIPPIGDLVRLLALPLFLGVLWIASMAYYNNRVFGSPITLPYQLNRATYATAPVLAWQKLRPVPAYRYKVMKDYYTHWEVENFQRAQTWGGFFRVNAEKVEVMLVFFCGIILSIPIVMLPWSLRNRRVRPLVLLAAIYAAGVSGHVVFFSHYAAPLTGAMYVFLLQSMRHLRVWSPKKRPIGLFLVRAIPVLCVLLALLRIFHQPLQIQIVREFPQTWAGTEPMGLERARILANLQTLPGGHLVMVKYSPSHLLHNEWGYNAADIDAAKVVWAREPETGDVSELAGYFRSRTIWLVEPDVTPARLSRFHVEGKNEVNPPGRE
jgi:hypothetical protein